MKIIDNKIIFKSDPENFYKERESLKPCTIRRISLWSELKDFELFLMHYNLHHELYHIKIINSSTHEEFERIITDITEFEGLYLICWKAT